MLGKHWPKKDIRLPPEWISRRKGWCVLSKSKFKHLLHNGTVSICKYEARWGWKSPPKKGHREFHIKIVSTTKQLKTWTWTPIASGKNIHFNYQFVRTYMGVSKNSDTPKWINFIMENPIKMDHLEVPPFSETPIHTSLFSLAVYRCFIQVLQVVTSFGPKKPWPFCGRKRDLRGIKQARLDGQADLPASTYTININHM